MNRLLVGYLQGAILLVEAAAMAPALLIALFYGDGDAMALAKSILVLLVVGLPLRFGCQPGSGTSAPGGFLVVALSWVALSAFGALPFVFSGELPNYEDAFFEAVSGFTTTGATVTTHFEGAPHGIMFWRSFTHWIGGMGVLVLTLALLPKMAAAPPTCAGGKPRPHPEQDCAQDRGHGQDSLHHLSGADHGGVCAADGGGHGSL